MADLLPVCLAFPPERRTNREVSAKTYDTNIKQFLHDLDSYEKAPGWTHPIDEKNILEILNPAVNSIPYLNALIKQLHVAGKDQKRVESLLPLLCEFCYVFDPTQLRYVGELWLHLIDFCCRTFPQLGVTEVSPLVHAILRLDPSAGTFTSSHLQIIRLSLQVGVPNQVLPILDKDIYAYPQTEPKKVPKGKFEVFPSELHELSNGYISSRSGHSFPLESNYVLQYYLLGASIYLGLCNYPRARLFLEFVLLSPTAQQSASLLQVEAYKKWVLVGLIAEGKVYPIPRTMDQNVLKIVRSLSKPYDALGEDFLKRDVKKLQAEVEVGGQMWSEDGNLRLVREVGEALQRYRVIDLRRTYAALPVSRAADLVQLPADILLRLLNDMINMEHLDASLTPAGNDYVLHFNTSEVEAIDVSEIDLQAQTQRIQNLATYIQDADRRIQLAKEYIDVARRTKRSGGGEDLAEAMDLSYDPTFHEMQSGDENDDDEDIMDGLSRPQA